jgi:nucleoside-diphosphate-sugar epimerase
MSHGVLPALSAGPILITGATGLLGTRLVRELEVRAPGRPIVALVRRPAAAMRLAAAGVRILAGDVAEPRLGMDSEEYREVASSVTTIVHAAADIRFDAPLEESRRVNLHGVRHMLEFALECPRLRQFAHVSTVYVNGYRQGTFLEEPTPPGQRFVNPYQQSKFEAETLVLDAMRRIPAAIYRLSLVIADSPEGQVTQFNYFHHLLRVLPGSRLPMIPGDPAVAVDLVTNDWAAAALAHLVDRSFVPGSIRHLCAGPAKALPLSGAVERICRTVENHPQRRLPGPVVIPRLVSIAEYNRFLAGCRDQTLRTLAEAVGTHVRLLAIRQSHRNDLASADLAGSGIQSGDPGTYLENTVRFCLDTDWGRNATALKSNAYV